MGAAALASMTRFSDRVIEFLDRIECRRLESDLDREAAYRLRYEAYLREGAILPNSAERLEDRFDATENSWTFGLYVEGRLASSIRVHVASPEHPVSPAVDAFADILGPELAAKRVIVDPNRFVADADFARAYPELPYATVRLGYVACGHFGADIGVATARAEHMAFYRRFMLLREACAPRPYPTLIKPLGLMAVHYPSVREAIELRYPFFRSTTEERARLFGPRVPLGHGFPARTHCSAVTALS